MHDIVQTHIFTVCMALHSDLHPLQQWAKGEGVTLPRHQATRALFDVRPRQRVSWQLNARESMEVRMLQYLQGNEAVYHDANILPFFGGLDTPLTSTAPFGKGTKRHKVDVLTLVARDATPDTQGSSHDFITLRRGMELATCKQVVRMWCNTCLVCHACFSVDPHPCAEVPVNVADDLCEDGESNNVDELATPVGHTRAVVSPGCKQN